VILFLLTVLVVGMAMLALAVGVLFSRPCLRGSCGGPDVLGPDGEPPGCGHCPLRPGVSAQRNG
jgi:hypothetical protein